MRIVAVIVSLVFAAVSAAQMVAPESLPQGFVLIVKDKSGLAGPESPLYFASN